MVVNVSVAVCTRNRCDQLRALLEMLTQQRLPGGDFRWELIVVDNASADATQGVVKEFLGRLPLRYVAEPNVGFGHARNRALREFSGGVLLFVDDDEIPAAEWINEMWQATLRWPAAEVFVGRVLPQLACAPPPWLSMDPQLKVRGPLPEVDWGEEERMLERPVLACGNAAIRPSAIEKAGFFRTDGRGEDHAYSHQLEKAGVKGVNVPLALIYHPVDPRRLTLAYYRQWNWASGRIRLRIMREVAHRRPFLGVPRHVPREYLQCRLRQLGCAMLGKHQLGLVYRMRAWKLEGMMYEAWWGGGR